jgi:hypothetical protein
MKQKRISFALGLMTILFAFLATSPAEAYCEDCRPILVCWDDCYIVDVCRPTNFPHSGREECVETSWYCYTSGDLCQWTELAPPPFLQPELAFLAPACS